MNESIDGVTPVTANHIGGWRGVESVPAGVVTEIGPVVAPSGTVAVMRQDPQVKVAAVPLKITEVAPPRLST